MRKQLLFILMMCLLSVMTKAQTIVIVNHSTTCAVDYLANYSPGGTCTMPMAGMSGVLLPGDSIMLVQPGGWSFATITDNCTPGNGVTIGNSCPWISPPLSFTDSWVPAPCSGCVSPFRTATWTNTGGGSARVDIN